jgi:hypothetical protein
VKEPSVAIPHHNSKANNIKRMHSSLLKKETPGFGPKVAFSQNQMTAKR